MSYIDVTTEGVRGSMTEYGTSYSCKCEEAEDWGRGGICGLEEPRVQPYCELVVCYSCEPQIQRHHFHHFTTHILLVIPVSVVCPDSGRARMIFYH